MAGPGRHSRGRITWRLLLCPIRRDPTPVRGGEGSRRLTMGMGFWYSPAGSSLRTRRLPLMPMGSMGINSRGPSLRLSGSMMWQGIAGLTTSLPQGLTLASVAGSTNTTPSIPTRASPTASLGRTGRQSRGIPTRGTSTWPPGLPAYRSTQPRGPMARRSRYRDPRLPSGGS